MKKLLLTLIVPLVFGGSIFAQNHTSHWADFNSGPFEMWDAIVAFIKIDDTYVTDNWEDFEVASFIDGECRGHAFLRMEEDITYPCVELPVYRMDSIVGNGEEVSFKLFDHVNGIEYVACTSSIPIITGTDYDELYLEHYDNAVVLDFAATGGSQTIELKEGYNWVSFYVEGDPVEMLGALQESLNEHGVTIEGTAGINYNLGDGYWWGDLDEIGITSTEMYLIEVDADCTIELPGLPCDPTTTGVTIEYGYNWISFPNSEEVEVNTALEGFEAGEEDMIEGPDGMIYYLGDGYWWGDFETFVPGQGYLYYYSGSETQTLYFQTGAKKVRSANLNVVSQLVKKVHNTNLNLVLPRAKNVRTANVKRAF